MLCPWAFRRHVQTAELLQKAFGGEVVRELKRDNALHRIRSLTADAVMLVTSETSLDRIRKNFLSEEFHQRKPTWESIMTGEAIVFDCENKTETFLRRE